MSTTADRIRAVYDLYTNELARIRDDRSLSDRGRLTRIARAYQRADQEMTALRQERERELAGERRRLQRRAFAAPIEDRVAYRDAIARCEEAATPDAALALLRRADRIGDMTLAKAVGTIAAERGWNGVVAAYAEAVGGSPALDELTSFEIAASDRTNQFAERMVLSVPPPPELVNLGGGERSQLAREADAEVIG